MRKCGAIKANGERCGRIVGASQVYCYAHDLANADKRKHDAAKAGRSTPNVELKEIKASIKDLTERVLTGRVDTGPAGIANQLMNTQLRIIELERRWKEVGELEGRMEALEDVLKWRKRDEKGEAEEILRPAHPGGALQALYRGHRSR